MMDKKNMHILWNKDMPEAKAFFFNFYSSDSKEIAEEEEELWNKYIEWNGKEKARKTTEQLTEIINSDMKDQEIEDFIFKKLRSEFLAPEGEARNWLIRIRDYLRSKINS